MTRTKAVCILLLLLAYGLSLWRLDAESIWHDEAWSIRAIDDPLNTPDDKTPPLYYMALHGLQVLGVGQTPFAYRYGSVLLHLLTVALGYKLAGRWFGFTAAGLFGLLLATSPLLWQYAQEVRAYVAVPLLALAFLGAADWLLRRPHKKAAWATIFVLSLVALYTHNLGVHLFIWLNLLMLGMWAWEKKWPLIGRWLILTAGVGILYLPWLLSQAPSGTGLNSVPSFDRELSQNIWRGYVFPINVNPDELSRTFIAGVHLLPLFVGVAALLILWRGRTRRAVLIVSQAALLPIFSTLLLMRASIDFHPRYYILAVPATLFTLGAGLASLPPRMRFITALIFALPLLIMSGASLRLMASDGRYQNDDFETLAAYYAGLPDDALIIIPFEDEPALQYYYAREHNIRAEFLNLPLHAPPDVARTQLNAALSQFEGARHVELLTWFQLPADLRGMYSCWFWAHSLSAPSYFESYGLSSLGYSLDSPLSAESLPQPQMRFNAPLDLTSWAYSVSDGGMICLETFWTSDQQNGTSYSAAVRLLNPHGDEMGASDGLILGDDQRGDFTQGAAFIRLNLPIGLPMGEYAALLRLYSPHDISGFDVLRANGQSGGKDLRFSLSLPRQALVAWPPDPRLLRDNAAEGWLWAGSPLRLELFKPNTDPTVLSLRGDGWLSESRLAAGVSLVWPVLDMPSEASGAAELFFGEQFLARYDVRQVERLFSPPDFEVALEAEFPDVARLIGANLQQDSELLRLDLVWQAVAEVATDYVIFAQLLDAEGRLLVQSDGGTGGAQRPMSSWLPDEYLLDSHALNLDGVHYKGEAVLIVGLYDPISFERVRPMDFNQVQNPVDFYRLPIEVSLE